jgi:Uma2 family endonuclease
MGAGILEKKISVEEYLSNPAYEHHEYVDGEVVERNVGTTKHGSVASRCVFKLIEWMLSHPGGLVSVEQHCRLSDGVGYCYRVPDVAYISHHTNEPFIQGAPDFAVEVRSPKDAISDQLKKFDEYFANGCKLGWLFIPEEEAVWVLAPGEPLKVFSKFDTLTGFELLPEFSSPVSFFFE